MKTLKKTLNLVVIFTTLNLILIASSQAQSNNNTIPQVDKNESKRARAIIFNNDQSASPNENFFVSFGNEDNWWNNVKLEVQREGGISARNGMFMDWSNLYLVADWDNTSENEDIIFGFNSNKIANITERMRLTDEGRLGIGTSSP